MNLKRYLLLFSAVLVFVASMLSVEQTANASTISLSAIMGHDFRDGSYDSDPFFVGTSVAEEEKFHVALQYTIPANFSTSGIAVHLKIPVLNATTDSMSTPVTAKVWKYTGAFPPASWPKTTANLVANGNYTELGQDTSVHALDVLDFDVTTYISEIASASPVSAKFLLTGTEVNPTSQVIHFELNPGNLPYLEVSVSNSAPTITGAVGSQAVNDNSTISPFPAGFSINDADTSQTLTVTVTPDNAAKGSFTSASLTASGFTYSGGAYTATGTASAVTTKIRQLVFAPTPNRVAVGSMETTTLTVAVNDGVASVVSNNTTTVISTSMNDAPTISGTASNQVVNDTGTLAPFSGVTIGDVDSPAQTLTVTVTPDSAAKGSFTPASLTASGFVESGGVYSATGTAAAVTSKIQALQFAPTANRAAVGSTETTTFTIAVNDGAAPAVTNNSTTVVSTSVNDAPAISGTVSGQAVNDTATISPFAGVTIGDADTPAQTLTVSISADTAAKGSFTAGSLTASGFTESGGVYSFSGTAASATTAIQQLVFAPAQNRVAPGSTETTTFTISASDGVAPAVTNSSTTVVSTSMNDAPTITGTVSGQSVNDDATIQPFSTASIGDADATQTLTVSISLDTAAKGTFTPASLTASGFIYSSGSYSATGTAADLTSKIRQLAYAPTPNRVAVGSTETTTFTITADDGVAAPVSDSTVTVVSTSVNEAPVISGAVGSQPVNDNATLTPFSTVAISDGDAPAQTLSVTVTYDTAAKGSFTPASLTASGFAESGGAYTLSGTAADVTSAIRQLVFAPAQNRVAVGATETTTFTITVTDNTAAPVSDSTATVVSTSANDAPTISGAVGSQPVNDDATVAPFAGVGIADADVSQTLTVTVSLDNAAKGSFTPASLTASGFSLSGGNYTASGTAADVTNKIQQLVFAPAANRVAVGMTETTTFTISVDDGVATAVNNSATTVISTSVNDAPVVAGTQSSQAVSDKGTLSPFAGVTISDGDIPAQTLTVTVALDSAAKGSFTTASLTAAGFTEAGGVYSASGTAPTVTAAIRQLVFAPAENRAAPGSTETTTFTVTVNDGTAPGVTDSATTVISTAANDAPVISGSVANQDVDDTATISPFAGVTISDSDLPAQTLTVTVTLDTAAKGAFTPASLTTSGFAGASGTYTASGTAAQLTAKIAQLVFAPAHNRGPVDSTETTTFTISVNDGIAAPVTDNGTTVVSKSINDAPQIGAIGEQMIGKNSNSGPIALTVSDPETATANLQFDKAVINTTLIPLSGITFSESGGIHYVTITPGTDQIGSTTVTITVQDENNATASASFTVTVGNAKPVALQPGPLTVLEDDAVSGDFQGTDTDNDPLEFHVTQQGLLGQVTITGGNHFTYTPNANANGTDSFVFTATDGSAVSNPVTVTVNITPVNDKPIAQNVEYSGNSLGTITGTLSATDVDGDALTFSLVSQGTLQSVTTAVYGNTFVYTPQPGIIGDDVLTFIASDGSLDSDPATLTIHVIPSGVADLTSLTVSTGDLTPAFQTNTLNYTQTVDYSVQSTTLQVTLADPGATVAIDGQGFASGQTTVSKTISNLHVGANLIPIVVTSQDAQVTQTYHVTITRLGNADLFKLVTNLGSLTPEFDPATTVYTLQVPNEKSSITVTAATYDPANTIKIQGAVVGSDVPSGNISLFVGLNAIHVVVASDDFVTTKTYKLNVTRADAPGGGGGSTPSESDGIAVIVDGVVQEKSATAVIAIVNGKKQTTIIVDNNKVIAKLEKDNNRVLTIPLTTQSDIVVGEINGKLVKAMEGKSAIVEIVTPRATYTLPASQIKIDNLVKKMGAHLPLEDIKISIKIAEASESNAQLIQSDADREKLTIAVKPIEFEVVAEYDGQKEMISKFSSFVSRGIAVPDEVDPNKITTGVVLGSDGKVIHVPTKVLKKNEKYYAVINSLTNSAYSVVWNPESFADVERHWSKDDVNDLASRLVVQGVGAQQFAPDKAITRAEFSAIVVRALGLKPEAGKPAFSDVSADDWYAGFTQTASEYGLINGYEDGTFAANRTITREEAIVIIARAMALTNLADTKAGSLASFTDESQISSWAKEAVAQTVQAGITQGSFNQIHPKDDVTRAETAALVRRMLQQADLINR